MITSCSIYGVFTELVKKRERERNMSLFVNTNINSLIAQRSLNSANSSLQSAITRLSTGYRVNQAGDDAAGLCVARFGHTNQR